MNRETELQNLFNQLVTTLTKQVQKPDASPSTLNVARQLLKDCEIGVLEGTNKGVNNLKELLPFPSKEELREENHG